MATRANHSFLGRGENEPAPHNYTMIQAFEWESEGGGQHWKLLETKSQELAEMGISAAWIPPPCKASSPNGNGYDIYDLWDLGEFDSKGEVRTKWGTKDELLDAVRAMKDCGIATYIDAVLNHKAGADFVEKTMAQEVSNEDRSKTLSDVYEIEAWTGFNFPGRKSSESQEGVDYDNKTQKNAIFRIEGNGKHFSNNVDGEKGNYDYLMYADIDHAHGEVSEECKKWGAWVIRELGASGFRFDAIKHIDRGFMGEFVKYVRKEVKNPDLFCVGEFWKDSYDDMNQYLNGLGTQFSVFDAPLHYNMKQAADQGSDYDIRKIFDGALVQHRPMDAVTLVDNHDSQPYQALESWVGPQFKPLGYALILLRPDGYPCVFWGDLYGIGGTNKFEPMTQLADFIRARKLFAYGELRDYWDHQNCVAWVRDGDENHDGCAVVICNGSEGSKRMEVGKQHGGEKWTDCLGWHEGEVTIDDDGWGDFKCPGMSVSIWTKTDARGRDDFKK